MKKTLLTAFLGLTLGASAQVASFDFAADGSVQFNSIYAASQNGCVIGNAAVTKNSVNNSYSSAYGVCTSSWTTGNIATWADTFNYNFSLDSTSQGVLSGITMYQASSNPGTSPQFWAARVLDSSSTVVAQTGAQTFANTGTWTAIGADTANFTSSLDITGGGNYTVQYTAWGGTQGHYVYLGGTDINGQVKCVPEPSSVLLTALAGFGFLAQRKRK